MSTLGSLVDEQLHKREMMRAELAEALGITPVSVTKWLNGRAPFPWRHYVHLSEVLHLPLSKILAAAKEDSPAHVEQFQRYVYRPVSR
jgi:transcriptional regulator with XRE-family HTH domain